MSVGAILVGAAVALLVGAYLARPFRRAWMEPDRAIEQWVAQVRAKGSRGAEARGEEPVNFCPQCGRRVAPDDRFCARCGTRLRGGAD